MADQLVPVLRVADAQKAAEWYSSRLGFQIGFENRYSPEFPAYVEVTNGDLAIHLSELPGDATPDTLIFIYVDDLEATASAHSLDIIETTWSREVRLVDPDGNRVRLGELKYPVGHDSEDENGDDGDESDHGTSDTETPSDDSTED